jgi:hypothetical protein
MNIRRFQLLSMLGSFLGIPLIALLAWFAQMAFGGGFADVRISEPEQLTRDWVFAGNSLSADAPNAGKNLNVPACAAVSFLVERNGTTSTIKVRRVVPDGDLGKVAASAVAHMQFKSTDKNAERKRVFTYLVFPFNLPDASSPDPTLRKQQLAQRQQVLDQCKLEPLTAADIGS